MFGWKFQRSNFVKYYSEHEVLDIPTVSNNSSGSCSKLNKTQHQRSCLCLKTQSWQTFIHQWISLSFTPPPLFRESVENKGGFSQVFFSLGIPLISLQKTYFLVQPAAGAENFYHFEQDLPKFRVVHVPASPKCEIPTSLTTWTSSLGFQMRAKT